MHGKVLNPQITEFLAYGIFILTACAIFLNQYICFGLSVFLLHFCFGGMVLVYVDPRTWSLGGIW